MEFNLSVKMDNPFKRKERSVSDGNTGVETESRRDEIRFDSMSDLKGIFPGEYHISLSEAMKFTAVFAAIRLRAESIASLPKVILENTEKGKIEAINHPAYKLLKYRPNGYMNIFSFWEYTNACLDGWGNAYVLIIRARNGSPEELIPLHPSTVTPTLSNKKKWFRVVGSKFWDGVYSDEDMLHFFSLSEDGIKGVNPISYNSAAIRTGISATKFGNEFFEKGGNIKGVFETDQSLSAKDYKEMMEHLSSYSNFETPIMENGLKYRSIGIAPEAAQMLQTRTFALQDIARIFNVPVHLLAELSRATFSNIEHQDIQYVKYSLRSTVKRFEVELELKLLFCNEIGRAEIKFNLDGLLRGDMKARAEYYSKAITYGWHSRNEVREMENANRVEGLDEYLYPSNSSIAGKEQDKKIKK